MSVFASETDFEKLPPAAQNSLTFLRGLRDAVGRDLEFDLNTDRAEEWIEEMASWKYPQGAFNAMSTRIMQDRPEYISRKFGVLKLFKRIAARIARLEREGCRVPKEFWDRELLNA